MVPAGDGARQLSSTLGNPTEAVPASKTPAGPTDPGRCRLAARPPPRQKAGTPATNNLTGLERLARTPGCLRSAGWVAPPPRKTRFWLLARLCQVGLATHRVPTKGFRCPTSFLLSQASPGATTALVSPFGFGGCLWSAAGLGSGKSRSDWHPFWSDCHERQQGPGFSRRHHCSPRR